MTRRTSTALALATVLAAAADVALTGRERPYRPWGWDLAWQTLLLWSVLALLVALPARWLARRLDAPLAAALALLALPVALHATLRDAVRTPGGLREPSTWGAALLALLAVLLGAGFVRWLERRRGVAAVALVALTLVGGPAPERSAPSRPDLLLLVWDTTRADRTGPYGYARQTTPHLAELAEQGVVFEDCLSASVFTLSSHVSLLTGLSPGQHGTGFRRQAVRVETIAEELRRAGYRTGAVVGTSVLTGGRGLERGFEVYDDLVDPPVCDTHLWALVHDVQALLASWIPALRGNGLPHLFQDFQRPAGETLGAALDFIEADDGRPWFLMVNLFDVHWPYLPRPEAYERWVSPYEGVVDGYLFRSDSYPQGYVPGEDDKRFVGELYDAEMWDLDRAVDGFLAAARLPRDDAVVLLTSDHGEGLGEAGRWSHEHLYAPQTHVPLVLCAPGRLPAGTRVAAPVSGLDVAPALLELAGLSPAGTSVLLGSPPPERTLCVQDFDNPTSDKDAVAVVRGRYLLVRSTRGTCLYDREADPLGERDLAAEHPELVAELEQLLQDSAASDEELALDNADALDALGYLGN